MRKSLPQASVFVAALLLLTSLSACSEAEQDAQDRTAPAASDTTSSLLLPVVEDGRWGYIDRSGQTVIDPQFDQAWRFVNGLALVRQDDRFGFIREDGSFAVQPRFRDAWHFAGGLAPVQIDTVWALVDRSGEVVSDTPFDIRASTLVESRDPTPALHLLASEGLYGYATADGESVIDPQFENAWRFVDGLARAKSDGQWGYIDREGTFVIEPRFDLAWDFGDGVAMVQIGERIGYIDRQGRYIWDPRR